MGWPVQSQLWLLSLWEWHPLVLSVMTLETKDLCTRTHDLRHFNWNNITPFNKQIQEYACIMAHVRLVYECNLTQPDANREQQLKWTQSGSSWVWPRKTGARQRRYRIRLLVQHSRGGYAWAMQGGESSEASLYVCNEERTVKERTVVHHSALMQTEVRAQQTSAQQESHSSCRRMSGQ